MTPAGGSVGDGLRATLNRHDPLHGLHARREVRAQRLLWQQRGKHAPKAVLGRLLERVGDEPGDRSLAGPHSAHRQHIEPALPLAEQDQLASP
jgi:hypothetical protein